MLPQKPDNLPTIGFSIPTTEDKNKVSEIKLIQNALAVSCLLGQYSQQPRNWNYESTRTWMTKETVHRGMQAMLLSHNGEISFAIAQRELELFIENRLGDFEYFHY